VRDPFLGPAGFFGPPRLKLIPKLTKLKGLIRGQEVEDAIGRLFLPICFRDMPGRVVPKSVPGIDFNDVVDQDKFQDLQTIDAWFREMFQ
jgi:hypothetical protein